MPDEAESLCSLAPAKYIPGVDELEFLVTDDGSTDEQ